jgi:hypothetical protein
MRLTPLAVAFVVASSTISIPEVASAQAAPVDQPFVIASRMPMAGQMALNLTPTSFGCSANQAFYVREVYVSAQAATPVYWHMNLFLTQAVHGGGQLPAIYTFVGNTGNLGLSTTTTGVVYALPSVGAPVFMLEFSRDNGPTPTVNITVWGYCGAPTTLGPLSWH